jgi:hypothetical protein
MSTLLLACVNKSGRSMNVYSNMNGQGSVLGQIVQNECYTFYGREGSGISVVFKAPNGRWTSGYLKEEEMSNKCTDEITQYPYGRHNSNYTFMLRRNATFKNSSGTTVDTLMSGTTIVCRNAKTGANYTDYLHIIGILQNGQFVAKEGFVEMGYQFGSSGKTLTVYGTF